MAFRHSTQHDQAIRLCTEPGGVLSKVSVLIKTGTHKTDQLFRARLPSLYSDFSLQRYSNPDGYAANVAVWEDVLMKAAGEGLMPPGPDGPELLSIRMSEELLRSLEIREWGKPLALGKVIVCEHLFLSAEISKPDLSAAG